MSYGTNSRYREMEVLAMSPARRLVMLYTKLLVLLKQARTEIERGDIEAREKRLMHADEIVRELAMSLNFEAGGDLARSLESIYNWLLNEFAGIHARPDLIRLDAVIRIVADLHEAWDGAAAQVAGHSAP
jgi:flagellar protein FliS